MRSRLCRIRYDASRQSLFYWLVTDNMSCISAVLKADTYNSRKVWKWYKTGPKAPMSNRYLLKYRFKLTLFELFLNLLRLDTVTIFSSILFQQSITLSPKKGSLSDCNNWKGITLLSVPGKTFCRVLLNRLKDEIDHTLRQEQAGFRSGRSCCEQIFTLRNII